MYAAKTDSSHADIRDGLRHIFGRDAIQDVSKCRGLGFDLIAIVRGRLLLLEVKPPKRASKLTDSEQAARARFGEHWRCVTTLEEAIEALS